MNVSNYTVHVSGRVQSGRLELSGTSVAQSPGDTVATLSSFQATADSVAMNGEMTLKIEAPGNIIVFGVPTTTSVSTLSLALEQVFKAGTAEGSRPLPAAMRAGLLVTDVTANRSSTTTSSVEAGTSYRPCYSLTTVVSVGATAQWTITPIGPDGEAYSVQQRGTADRLSAFYRGKGCGATQAFDANFRRPIASQARVRVDILFDDGVTTALEAVHPVRVTSDATGP